MTRHQAGARHAPTNRIGGGRCLHRLCRGHDLTLALRHRRQRCRVRGTPRRLSEHVHLVGGRNRLTLFQSIDAGRDHRDANRTLEFRIEPGAEDDVRGFVHFLADAAGSEVNLMQRHVVCAGDVDQHTASTFDRRVVEQWIVDRGFGGFDRAIIARRFAGAHHRLAHLFHHRAYIGEVEIDQAGIDHQVGDATHARVQHVVGELERIRKRCAFVRDAEQILVGDNYEGIYVFLKLENALLGKLHAMDALELEGLRHDADRQNPLFLRRSRNHGRSARAGAAAHTGSDEHHVVTFEIALDLVDGFFGRDLADVRARAGAKAMGDGRPELYAMLGKRLLERLGVGVRDDELHALELAGNHVVDRIAAGAADANHRDARFAFARLRLEFDGHADLQVGDTFRFVSIRL